MLRRFVYRTAISLLATLLLAMPGLAQTDRCRTTLFAPDCSPAKFTRQTERASDPGTMAFAGLAMGATAAAGGYVVGTSVFDSELGGIGVAALGEAIALPWGGAYSPPRPTRA